ncbi:MAG: hypothetical protein ACRDRG_21425 [Pseudonocardiaceae bacterium]
MPKPELLDELEFELLEELEFELLELFELELLDELELELLELFELELLDEFELELPAKAVPGAATPTASTMLTAPAPAATRFHLLDVYPMSASIPHLG